MPNRKAAKSGHSNGRISKPSHQSRGPSRRPEPRELEDATVMLATTGKLAGAARRAIRAQREAGLPVTYQRGNKILMEYPDGRKVVIGTIEPPSQSFTFPRGVRRIRGA